MDSLLQTFHEDLKALRRTLKAETTHQVAKKSIREKAESIGRRWFKDIEPGLQQAGNVPADALKKYAAACERLIRLSAPNNLRSSYLETLDALVKPMRNELILPIQASAGGASAPTMFDSFVASLKNPEESAYFQEAIDCAKKGFLRAATVMAWCAAIDRIHKKIEIIGFSTFSVTSAQMTSQQKGRFKRFNQTQSVNSLSELREVFVSVRLVPS